MSNTSDSGSPSWDSEVNYVGCVKWFNNKAGYGFLTVMDGDKQGEDVFCHHSGVVVTSEQYKYLVQGEYVSFSLRESDSDSHPYQAGNITGVCNGKLMCETRAETDNHAMALRKTVNQRSIVLAAVQGVPALVVVAPVKMELRGC